MTVVQVPLWVAVVVLLTQFVLIALYALLMATLKWQSRGMEAQSQRLDAQSRSIGALERISHVHAERLGLAVRGPAFRYDPEAGTFERVQ